ncbi:Rieske 2Fe-2S domain-containing protein [Brucepastera parasyntrophica]|uniref:Rieske 2Fe-2S domain-containing protein n=1 Tax=Brucepastera parasyntrophica TaxID=2880008 RepID=UPI00210E8941|nr:Rieske 2Fe-2S domain-containing protein [Brucepastera parasyntrophica]
MLSCAEDRCAHRGAALCIGKLQGECIQCPFHGIQYDTEGKGTFVPALGKSSAADLGRFHLIFHRTKEEFGIIYLWFGEGEPDKAIPFFRDELDGSVVYSELEDCWNAFYSRCVENQLDVIHLPFVHYNTIGRGNKTLVNGPKVLFEHETIITSANNEVDRGQTPKTAEESVIRETYLKFIFPNLWMNHISEKFRVVIFFAPVDESRTVLYIRFYSSLSRFKCINRIIAIFGRIGNRIIERQDRRVVITQKLKVSEYHSNEKLLPGDRPVILYRRLRDELKQQNAAAGS